MDSFIPANDPDAVAVFGVAGARDAEIATTRIGPKGYRAAVRLIRPALSGWVLSSGETAAGGYAHLTQSPLSSKAPDESSASGYASSRGEAIVLACLNALVALAEAGVWSCAGQSAPLQKPAAESGKGTAFIKIAEGLEDATRMAREGNAAIPSAPYVDLAALSRQLAESVRSYAERLGSAHPRGTTPDDKSSQRSAAVMAGMIKDHPEITTDEAAVLYGDLLRHLPALDVSRVFEDYPCRIERIVCGVKAFGLPLNENDLADLLIVAASLRIWKMEAPHG
ncbi:hypothetical protein [Ancylobacter radicis]|uniref:Uncharacterized protein n=1 Tax=Ancylobacter radicis TaxID=2836179 RepID=A0ABS5R5X0_9HYPH|nr:hypothetical protein [Ancylobacter radicis]MBS9476189.1 hypothetical protein [Ancylobacter radicis]